MSENKILKALNQPFVLWFLSTVIIGFISWQYGELQKQSSKISENELIVKKSKLEVSILLDDVMFISNSKENLQVNTLNALLLRLQYQMSNSESPAHFPTLQNLMLEIDSRTELKGLELFRKMISRHIKIISAIQTRIIKPHTMITDKIWSSLTEGEKNSFNELADLSEKLLEYYQ